MGHAEHRIQAGGQGPALGGVAQDRQLGVPLRVPHGDAHEEPVELALRERIGALVVGGVLGGDHHEGRSEPVGDTVHGDLPFGHGLQQGRLGLG
jgi:hypothetical protein